MLAGAAVYTGGVVDMAVGVRVTGRVLDSEIGVDSLLDVEGLLAPFG
jgi:hypothetical protein